MDRYMAWQSAQDVERARSGCGVTLDYHADSAQEVENLLATRHIGTHRRGGTVCVGNPLVQEGEDVNFDFF